MCAGNGVPESIRSDASDQEEDEESESGPVAISKALLYSSLFSAFTVVLPANFTTRSACSSAV